MRRIRREIAELEAIRPAWLELWARDPLSTVFNHPDWHLSFLRALSPESLLAITSEGETGLECIWLLQGGTQRAGGGERTLHFLGDPFADYARPSLAPGSDVDAAVRTLLAALRDEAVPMAILNEFRSDDPLPERIAALAPECGYRAIVEQGTACPRISRTKDPAIFTRKFRRSANQLRVLKELGQLGDQRFARMTSREEILACLPEFFVLHTARWAGIGETIFVSPAMRAFYTEIVTTMPLEMIFFTSLRVGERIVAMDLDFAHAGCLYWYKAAFDITMPKVSPGLALLCHLGRAIDDAGFHTLDFTRGEEAWKLRFANEVVHNRRAIIYRHQRSRVKLSLATWARQGIVRDLARRQRLKYALVTGRTALRKYGPLGLLGHQVRRTIRRQLKTTTMLLFRSGEPDPASAPLGDDLVVRAGSMADVFAAAELVDHVDMGRYVRSLLARFRWGDELYLAYLEGELVHAAWVAYRQRIFIREVKQEVWVGENTAYIYDCYTSPLARGHGIYTRVLRWITAHAVATKGCAGVAVACASDNPESRRGIEKAGFVFSKKVHQPRGGKR